MKATQTEIENLVNDLVSQRFDEVDDLCRFVQNRLGKMDNRTAMLFWAGKEQSESKGLLGQCVTKFEVPIT